MPSPPDTEVKLRATLDALPGLMFLFTTDGTYLDFHATDPDDLLMSPDQFIGKNVRDVMPPSLSRRFLDAFTTSSTEQRLIEVDYSLLIGGRTRHYEARIRPCGTDRVLAIVSDLTEQRDAETALHEMRSEFDRASRLSAAGELAATVAHEINQPLSAVLASAIAGLNQLRKDPLDRAELEEILVDIARDAQRGTEIIQKIRDLFRSASQQKRPVDVNLIIREGLDLTRHRIESDHVDLELQLAAGLPSVLGDATELRQVMLNLIGNALDAMAGTTGESRKLEIRSSLGDAGDCLITFRDHGSSIPSPELERVFEPFFTSKSDGMGIGLSVCRAIIDAHHGQLRAVSVEGAGAMLEIRLPSFRQLAVREA